MEAKTKSVVIVAPRAIVAKLTEKLEGTGVHVLINVEDNPKFVRIVCAERHQVGVSEIVFDCLTEN